jgi:CheY-like chemotaxis protein
VLVIDDNMDTADSLARFLRIAVGHEVRVAYDGASGVKMATAALPDVVVCDIAMPKLSGLRVADALAQLTPKPLLIAVTAFAGEFPEARAREAGFDFYLAKPADPFVVEALIQNRGRQTNGH